MSRPVKRAKPVRLPTFAWWPGRETGCQFRPSCWRGRAASPPQDALLASLQPGAASTRHGRRRFRRPPGTMAKAAGKGRARRPSNGPGRCASLRQGATVAPLSSSKA